MAKQRAVLIGLLLAAGCGEQTEVVSLPVADAGFDRVVEPSIEVRLDGSASYDPDGADLTYTWMLLARPTGSSADLVGESTVAAKLTPDVPGRYVAALTVSNGSRESLPDTVAVTARSSSAGIVADAACVGECNVAWGDTAQVSEVNTAGAAGSYTYAWTRIEDAGACATDCPKISNCTPLADPVVWQSNSERVASFTAPCALGSLVLRVTVTDDATSESDSACVELTTTNTPPVANIRTSGLSGGREINDTETFTLIDNGSYDPDTCENTIESHQWVQQAPAAPLATISTPTGDMTTVTLPNVDGPTPFIFALIVSDGDAFSATPCDDIRAQGGCGVRVDVLDVN